MTFSRAFQGTAGFAFDLLVGILPALCLLTLNVILVQFPALLLFLALSAFRLTDAANVAYGLFGGLALLAVPLLGMTACLALIGALIARHRAGGLTRLSGKGQEFLRIFLTLGIIFPVPGFLLFGREDPLGFLLIGQDPLKFLGVGGLFLLNAYIYLCPAAMSYRTLRLLKTAGGST